MILFWIFFAVILILTMLAISWPLRRYRYLFPVVVICFPASVILLYAFWGNSLALSNYYASVAKQQLIKQQLAKFHGPADVINQLKASLKQHPNSAKGWYLLGRLYYVSSDYHQASAAFAQAYRLAPRKFDYAFPYLQSLYLENNRQLTPPAQTLLSALTAQYANKPEVINFIAINAYLHQDYSTAIENWQRLLPSVAQNSAAQQQLLTAIAKAQEAISRQSNL